MLLMVEKGIKGGIRHSIHRYAKANNKYMKDYDKNRHIFNNNLYGWTMPYRQSSYIQKLQKMY